MNKKLFTAISISTKKLLEPHFNDDALFFKIYMSKKELEEVTLSENVVITILKRLEVKTSQIAVKEHFFDETEHYCVSVNYHKSETNQVM